MWYATVLVLPAAKFARLVLNPTGIVSATERFPLDVSGQRAPLRDFAFWDRGLSQVTSTNVRKGVPSTTDLTPPTRSRDSGPMPTKWWPTRRSGWLALLGCLLLLLAAACVRGATAPVPDPPHDPALTAAERDTILAAFKSAFDHTEENQQHQQHQVHWLPNDYGKAVLIWIAPPGDDHFRIGECSPSTTPSPPGRQCVRGRVENTTEHAMIDTFAACGHEDGNSSGRIPLGTIRPAQTGTWEWPHLAESGRYLCRLGWVVE